MSGGKFGNEKFDVNPEFRKSDTSDLLCANWVAADLTKPPENTFVLVDSDYFKTMVVAAWSPKDEKEFPWKISTGREMERWAEDTIKAWQHLPPHYGT